ncbi:hypothetical protein ONE63_010870 [Megalurothrips usitatus]|uniref:LEM domain-containing protein n=1 Tax=Megalurothrips usitatus TaxID=439358 RepID=A0AAV7XFC6_9NEOP|nr:hypothetical protein ONE63_010870 [Megalurothrips usitatus]
MLAEQIKNYSDLELREQLTGLGMDVGPITGTTRSLYERKLVQLLTGTRSEFSEDSPKKSPPNSPPKPSPRPSPPAAKPAEHVVVVSLPVIPTYDAADGLHRREPTAHRPSSDSTINLIRARKPVLRTQVEEPVSHKSMPRQSSPFPAANARFRKAESGGSAMDHILKFVLFAVVMIVIVYFISNQDSENAIEHRS